MSKMGRRRKREKSHAKGELSQVATGLQLADGSHQSLSVAGTLCGTVFTCVSYLRCALEPT